MTVSDKWMQKIQVAYYETYYSVYCIYNHTYS